MAVRKFLAIYDRVAKHIAVLMRPSYALSTATGAGQPPAIHVEHLESRGALILVHLGAPVVTCKARDRKKARMAVETSCCG
jgi:hypothetical protein